MSISVEVEYPGGRTISAKLASVPKPLRARFREALRTTAESVRQQAAANASWSTQIPASLTVRVSFARSGGAVYIQARKRRARHARLYEGIQGERSFRHRLFGNTNRWYMQETRPFLVPALLARGRDAAAESHRAIHEVSRRAGFTVS